MQYDNYSQRYKQLNVCAKSYVALAGGPFNWEESHSTRHLQTVPQLALLGRVRKTARKYRVKEVQAEL